MKKLTKQQKQEAKQAKLKRRADDIQKAKTEVMQWLGIGGIYSTLEIVCCAAAKLNMVLRGDIHENQQIKFIAERIRRIERPIKTKRRSDDNFYSSRLWKIIRYQALELHGNKCVCCGASPSDGVSIHVDHIKPRSTHPELELDINNLQPLCEDCNVGKINQWDTSWIGS
jgi:5-methylcytosine-specific restriction endonuclease McrA